MEYIIDTYRNFLQGIKNFWYYRKVIYNDRWYDHGFLLMFLDAKLKNMSDNWDSSHYLDSDVEKKELLEASRLLNLLINDNFLEDAMHFMDEKYGTLELNNDESDRTSLFLRNNKEPSKEEDEDWTKACDNARVEKQRVQQEFFNLFETKYEKWWD